MRKLHSVDQLPEINSEFLILLWDQDWDTDEIQILFGERVIFRQPVSYEYHDYFVQACRILKEKYGYHLLDVVPTPRALTFLWGDRYGADETTDRMRELLGRDNQPYYGHETAEMKSRRDEWKTFRMQYDQK